MKASFCLSSSFCFSDRGMIENCMEPTCSVRMSPSDAALWRSSRMVAATVRDSEALVCRTLKTSADVTASSCSRQES